MTSLVSPCHNEAGRDVSSEPAGLRASEESLPVMTSRMMSSEPLWSRLTSRYSRHQGIPCSQDIVTSSGNPPTDRTLWRTIGVTSHSPMTQIPASWCQRWRRYKARSAMTSTVYTTSQRRNVGCKPVINIA